MIFVVVAMIFLFLHDWMKLNDLTTVLAGVACLQISDSQ